MLQNYKVSIYFEKIFLGRGRGGRFREGRGDGGRRGRGGREGFGGREPAVGVP